MKKVYAIIGASAICVLLATGFIFSGLINVAASEPENALVDWVLSTTMKRSVAAHANGIDVPALGGESQLMEGLSHYSAMCADCHGAPGVEPAGFSLGLNPPPPKLTEEGHEWEAAELFWITKHGVKMTGMPEFGRAHSDAELWAMVAFVQELPTMTSGEYARKLNEAEPHAHDDQAETEESEHGHDAPQDEPHDDQEHSHDESEEEHSHDEG